MSDIPMGSLTWTVVGQTETTGLSQQGIYTRGKSISVRLQSGTQFSVFIPDSEYNVEHVRAMIAQEAVKVSAINGLTG